MSGKLPASASIEFIAEHIQSLLGGLDAEPSVASEVAVWEALANATEIARIERDVLRRKLARCRRHTQVIDARWDYALTKLSSRAYEIADKKATHEPYASLFGSITARDACQFGADRATTFGAKLLEKLDALGHPDLAERTETFRKINDALQVSGAARDAAELAAASLDVQRIGLRQTVEKQAAATEVAVLTANPGRNDLVSALLSPDRAEPAPHPPVAQPAPTAA